MKRITKTFLIWLVIINGPMAFAWVPGLNVIAFLPGLFWINIPGLYLAEWIGAPHYDVQEFGAIPRTALGWGLIILFWVFVTLILTGISEFILKFWSRRR